MGKPNKNKHHCEKYKASGAREFNKSKKQERHQKRMLRFAERRADGKAYEYKPNPYKQNTKKWHREAEDRARKNADKRLPLQKHDSMMHEFKKKKKGKK